MCLPALAKQLSQHDFSERLVCGHGGSESVEEPLQEAIQFSFSPREMLSAMTEEDWLVYAPRGLREPRAGSEVIAS